MYTIRTLIVFAVTLVERAYTPIISLIFGLITMSDPPPNKKIRPREFPKGGIAWCTLCTGGEGGIRTLDELSTHTRVPVVRHKPG